MKDKTVSVNKKYYFYFDANRKLKKYITDIACADSYIYLHTQIQYSIIIFLGSNFSKSPFSTLLTTSTFAYVMYKAVFLIRELNIDNGLKMY
jgi:hypothetical protein